MEPFVHNGNVLVMPLQRDAVEASSLPVATSAQQAELHTGACAYTLGKDKTGNIYPRSSS